MAPLSTTSNDASSSNDANNMDKAAVTFSHEGCISKSEDEEDATYQKNNEPVSLEGVLHMRKGRSTGSSLFWRRRYVVLNLFDGGVCCYRFASGRHKNQGSAYMTRKRPCISKLHRRASLFGEDEEDGDILALSLPASLNWTVKDIANDPLSFVIELDTAKAKNGEEDVSTTVESQSDGDPSGTDEINASFDLAESNEDALSNSDESDYSYYSEDDEDEEEAWQRGSLLKDMEKARRKGKPLRLYFRCIKGGNEKVLWLKAFSRMGRLSSGFRQKKFLLGTLRSKTAVRLTTSRRRSASSAAFVRQSKNLDTTTNAPSSPRVSINLNFARARNRDKEHKVLPEYLYPNVWMTEAELREEMDAKSETFHDLRQNASLLDLPNNPCKQPEVGTLQIECLQGLGFPKLDRYSQTDAVVYIVSGPYAFCTDVIKNKANPMWLAKTQRACIIPLHHGYAKVYIGVFDDEKSEKDDFNGRIVLDVSRLRPDCTYDVTLPLRLSSHVYSRRRRGALRLRFRLNWGNLRSALLSYLEIPQRRDFKPNTDTVVACGSARAFRNVAITVHGAHLPGKFSFTLLRATLRELNFTRKQVMSIFRQTIRELREWENPLLSCFVFCAWMHCIYHNSVSKVPAYVVAYFLLILLRNYARYGMDGPAQRGFIPPSWEELLWGLLRNPTSYGPAAIKPLDMGYQTEMVDGSPVIKYSFETHEPQGKALFRTLGFGPDDDTLEGEGASHLEFPFADGKVYPKFGVGDSLVVKKKKNRKSKPGSPSGRRSASSPSHGSERHFIEMPEILRKDASGLYDYDDEEQRFATGKFLRKTGATSLKEAANGLFDVGEGLSEVTGLQYVVSPIKDGLQHYVVPPIRSSIKGGINGINYVAIQPLQHRVDCIRRSSTEFWPTHVQETAQAAEFQSDEENEEAAEDEADVSYDDLDVLDPSGRIMFSEWGGEDQFPLAPADSTSEPVPDQDIDYGGNASNGKNGNRKRLTDDLVEVKEKFHELTFHKFNDSAYSVKDSDSRPFKRISHQRPFKRRRVGVSRDLDKLLQIGPYSHSNPVVARVGQYVEPIVGASHSFLCAFRALFNVMTWRDPFFTFWVSLFGMILVMILFVFPWRPFLLVTGAWFVGPHNWAIQILRKRGTLPPRRPRSNAQTSPEDLAVPDDQVVFKGHISQDQRRKSHKPVDPREVQYVVVPYSPLMYQRFYDWPPEEDYAQVRPDKPEQTPSSPTMSLDSDGGAGLSTANSFFSSTIASSEKKDQ